jgi:hypothetical protein
MQNTINALTKRIEELEKHFPEQEINPEEPTE